MKLLPSPSISASSTASFDATMCTSKSATAGCLAGILRRILCSRSLPTHPSDHITETSSLACDNKHQDCIKSQAPGIVARLMGLESLPVTSSIELQMNAKPLSRSKSWNSTEFREESDQMQRQHRRVKSTMPFPEMPTFLELENEKFLVLSFENNKGTDGKRIRSNGTKCEVGRELRVKRSERYKNRDEKVEEEDEEMINKMVLRVLNEAELCNRVSEDEPANTSSPIKECRGKLNAVVLPEAMRSRREQHRQDRAKLRRRRNRKMHDFTVQNDEPECCSQDSSPVSVLDFGQFIIDPEVPTSEEDTKLGDSSSRSASSAELDNRSPLSQCIDDNLIADDPSSKNTEETCCGGWRMKAHHTKNYINLWGEICRLASTQVAESSWIQQKNCKSEEFQDISKHFGFQILDELLEELVHQFP